MSVKSRKRLRHGRRGSTHWDTRWGKLKERVVNFEVRRDRSCVRGLGEMGRYKTRGKWENGWHIRGLYKWKMTHKTGTLKFETPPSLKMVPTSDYTEFASLVRKRKPVTSLNVLTYWHERGLTTPTVLTIQIFTSCRISYCLGRLLYCRRANFYTSSAIFTKDGLHSPPKRLMVGLPQRTRTESLRVLWYTIVQGNGRNMYTPIPRGNLHRTLSCLKHIHSPHTWKKIPNSTYCFL